MPDEVRMQLCVGTSIAIIVPTTVRSFVTHRDQGAVLMDVVRAWALPAVIGVALGSVIAAFAPGGGVQDRVRAGRQRHRHQAAVRPRQLAARRRFARPPAA